jgi:hypothetical protein
MADLRPLHALPGPFAVVCHDAGAANLILAWLLAAGRVPDCRPVMEGPARALWLRLIPDGPALLPLSAALAASVAVLTGTGWASDLEHNARRQARAVGLPCVAVLDHYTNYRARFVRDGVLLLPDRLWVADDEAQQLAATLLPEVPVERLANSYLAQQAAAIAPIPRERPTLLYVLEPLRDDFGRGQPGELQALDFFMEHRRVLRLPDEPPIRLRPHPSEPIDKYRDWLIRYQSQGLDIDIDPAPDLAGAISQAAWVAGCQSFALVVALAAGRAAICTLPPWAPPCALPHRQLVQLKDCLVSA